MSQFNLSSRLTAIKPRSPSITGLDLAISGRSIWVLRDDELGGFWGTKFRKYDSIIEHCLRENVSEIICTGGINSNNLAAAAVLCSEFGINVTALAVEDHENDHSQATGNRLIIRTALSPERLVMVPRNERQSINARMEEIATKIAHSGKKTLMLQEGGGCIPAVKGCLTLADDILKERQEWPDSTLPDHIFIDSGTGLTAASLLAGLRLKAPKAAIKVHVIQMAGFDEQIQNAFSAWVTPATGISWEHVNTMVRVYRPLSPRSYGATNASVFTFIKELARDHGILTDPVYTAKLFARAFDLIAGQNLKGKILIIHTGGLSGLLGYSKQFS
jgi:1-aminocyclopropane-1-carboxylate deaminase/D-cysteine desulfhydrase-like pyridoxal-dependent ACC family enzyme